LIILLLSIGLTGCFELYDEIIDDEISPTEANCATSIVTIHLTSTEYCHHYNFWMDDKKYHSEVTVGDYSINNLSKDEFHVFRVVHHRGYILGLASKTEYVNTCNFPLIF